MESVAINTMARAQEANATEQLVRHRQMWGCGLLASGSLGFLCILVGLVLSFETLVGLSGGSMSTAGAFLAAAAFALLFLAAHCMDHVRTAERQMRSSSLQ